MTGLQCGEGRMMIDAVTWTQYINVTAHRQPRCVTDTATLPWQMPRQRTALGGKNEQAGKQLG